MKLWLDDVRDPQRYLPDWEDWTWVKTAREAIEAFQTGEVTDASLDHDLGLPSCAACRRGVGQTAEQYHQVFTHGCEHGEPTGYSVVAWLEEHPEFWPINKVRVHSANPAGAARMRQVIDKHYLEGR